MKKDRKAYDRWYRETHREEIRHSSVLYYEKNRARILARQREYQAGNREKRNARG